MKYITTLMVYFALLLQSSALQYLDFWDCKHHPLWNVTYEDMYVSQQIIQEFLYAYQHNIDRCKRGYPYGDQISKFGALASTYFSGLGHFAQSIEQGMIYRPTNGSWLAMNYHNCTLNYTSIDCYTKELSNCDRMVNGIKISDELNDKNDYNTTLGQLLWGNTMTYSNMLVTDSCAIAKVMNKSMAWVAGQYLTYMFRPREDIQFIVEGLKRGIYRDVNRIHYSTVAIHYRGGKLDWHRKVPSLQHYMNALQIKATELAKDGRPVAIVYLSSIDNPQYFHSMEYMKKMYPGPWEYKILSRYTFSEIGKEFEYYLLDHPEIPRAPFVFEMLADIELMVEADCFIGSISNIYFISTFLRYARYPSSWNLKYNCYIADSTEFICEENYEKKRDIYDRYFYHKGNAFTGGVPF